MVCKRATLTVHKWSRVLAIGADLAELTVAHSEFVVAWKWFEHFLCSYDFGLRWRPHINTAVGAIDIINVDLLHAHIVLVCATALAFAFTLAFDTTRINVAASRSARAFPARHDV